MSIRLLLVDDDDGYLAGLVALLGLDGQFEIVGRARNGAEAVGLAASLAPNVIVMDVDMPVMDGLEATRLIHERDASVAIVLISGSQFAEGAYQLLDSITVNDVTYPYLTKTRVPSELADKIRQAAEIDVASALELRDRYMRGELSLQDYMTAAAEFGVTPDSLKLATEDER